jgi:hypothetical protein
MFPWGSQVVPQDIPSCTAVLSHMVCSEFNSEVQRDPLLGLIPNVAKKLMMEKMKIEGSALKTHFLKQINIWQRNAKYQ